MIPDVKRENAYKKDKELISINFYLKNMHWYQYWIEYRGMN